MLRKPYVIQPSTASDFISCYSYSFSLSALPLQASSLFLLDIKYTHSLGLLCHLSVWDILTPDSYMACSLTLFKSHFIREAFLGHPIEEYSAGKFKHREQHIQSTCRSSGFWKFALVVSQAIERRPMYQRMMVGEAVTRWGLRGDRSQIL